MADLPPGSLQLPHPPQAGALQLNRSNTKQRRSSLSELAIRGAIIPTLLLGESHCRWPADRLHGNARC